MGVHRLNHAVLYVRDVARSVEFYGATSRVPPDRWHGRPDRAAFLRAPGSTNDHDLGLFQIGAAATVRRPAAAASGSTTWPGRSTRSASSSGSPACSRSGRARRRHRPRHHQGALCQGPRRAGVRGLLAGAGRAADPGHQGGTRAARPVGPGSRQGPVRGRHPRRRRHLRPRLTPGQLTTFGR